MKRYLSMLFVAGMLMTSCGDMDNNVNEDHSRADSMGMEGQAGYENPNTSTAPLRDTFGTDYASPTAGPDNATPKSSGQDSAVSTRQRVPGQQQ